MIRCARAGGAETRPRLHPARVEWRECILHGSPCNLPCSGGSALPRQFLQSPYATMTCELSCRERHVDCPGSAFDGLSRGSLRRVRGAGLEEHHVGTNPYWPLPVGILGGLGVAILLTAIVRPGDYAQIL